MNTQKCFKKALSIILSLALILTAVPFAFAAEYDKTGATKLTFSNDGITAEKGSYSGYKIEGTALSIKGSGTYILSGESDDGSVTVKKGVKGVTLVLNGLTLTSSDTAPLTCNKSSEATIIAENGTVNTLTDAAYNNDDTYPENENAENAVIKCKDGSNVTLCGTGTLNVISNGKNGIKSGATTENEGEASLTIKDITLNITTTVNDGINAEQLLNIESGNITVSAADDGLHCDRIFNIGKEGTDGPVIRITKSYEGIEGAEITVYSGDIEVHSSDDGVNAANSDLNDYDFTMTFAGGKTVVYAETGDGLDSNGIITVTGGTLIVWTQNKADNSALDSDKGIYINGGTVLAAGGSGGMGMKLSATQPCLIFGATRMGISGLIGNRPNGKSNDNPNEIPSDMPNGDPNGKPSDMPNGEPIDKPNDMPSDMPNDKPNGKPDEQRSLLGGDNLGIKAGEMMTLKDSVGNVLLEIEAPYEINSVVYSSSELTAGDTYSIGVGAQEKASSTASIGDNIGSNSNCKCLCHRSGVLGFIWKLAIGICKLFGFNKTCRCGAAHY